MSSQYQGEQPDQAGADPLSQFDAFRARQADDRAQQTQSAYTFPPEYAADPPSFDPPVPPRPVAPAGSPRGRGGRARSVALFAGVLALAVGVGFGAYEAVGSSGPAANVTVGTGGTATPAPATASAASAKHGRTVDVRVVVESIGSGSFTGRLVATGEQVTVQLDATTRFGTVARPFSLDQLSVGETVLVRGRRTAADTLTATVVAGG